MGNVRHFHPAVSEKPAFHKTSQTMKKAELRKIVIQPSAIGRGDRTRRCGISSKIHAKLGDFQI